jgi:Zn-dependent membrane protease YugP
VLGFFFQYWWVVLPALLLGMIAQARVRSTYAKYQQVRTASGMTGAEAAQRILSAHGVNGVPVEMVSGQLTDHYDPRSRTLRLSQPVYGGQNVAALGVAAHEAGHAIQDARSYFPLKARNAFYPVASFGSNLGPIIVFGGLLFGFFQPLITVGIILFSFAVLFSLVTLPVELNASSRALRILSTDGLLNPEEVEGARRVLNAAAMTYVAAALASVLTLLRLLLLGRRR